jgi:hypothetical protein
MNQIPSWLKRLDFRHSESKRLTALRVVYIVAVSYIILFRRTVWTPDLLFVLFMGVFFLYGKGRQFLYQFGPFIVLLLAYDSLRSFAPLVNHRVHYLEMVHFDRWLAGGILPTVQLQHWWYHGHLSWYDFYFYLLYMCHFLIPLLVAVLIWRYRAMHYNRYITAFLLLSYAGFLTYIAFPAAPPWMASEMGLIDPIHKISTDVWWSVGVHDYPSIYKSLSPNLVAAVPSLHAAYPTLIALFIWRAFGWRWMLAMIWYPLSIWTGIVYMGEHYVFDALIGIFYAISSFLVTNAVFDRYGADMRRTHARLRAHIRRRVVAQTSNR